MRDSADPLVRRAKCVPGLFGHRSAQAETAGTGAGGPHETGKGLQNAHTEVAGSDPALKMSELYAARGAGRQPGTLTQHEKEAKLRAFIPGGDKDLLSEIRRTSSEPDSARHLPPADSAALTLQLANLSPETKRVRAMQQRIAEIAGKSVVQKSEGFLQIKENKSRTRARNHPKMRLQVKQSFMRA